MHSLGGIGVVADQALDIPILDLLGKSAVGRLTTMRRRHRWQPVALVPTGAPTQVGELDHYCGAVLVTVIGQLTHPGHYFILIGEDVVEHRRAVLGHRRGSGSHGQAKACLGALDVVGTVECLGHPILRISRLMGCHHQPVFQGEMFELEGLQQRIVNHG